MEEPGQLCAEREGILRRIIFRAVDATLNDAADGAGRFGSWAWTSGARPAEAARRSALSLFKAAFFIFYIYVYSNLVHFFRYTMRMNRTTM